jgi:hypothetical protein
MFASVKGLVVVLTIAAIVFHLAKPIALEFMDSGDFARRRLVWFVLTAVAFLSPNFWLYALVAIPLVIWANRSDSNPVALYLLLLHVIPPVNIPIPILGNNGLFPLGNYRLLAFCVLLPTVIRYRKIRDPATIGRLGLMDVLLLAIGALQVALYTAPDLPHHLYIPDSPSNALRRAFLFLLDTFLLFFAVSRTCQSRRKMVEAAATFCLACAVMAALAVFERTRNWLLYVDIPTRWEGSTSAAFYLSRGGAVRAQVSAGHSIALGNLLAVGLGFWLCLESYVSSKKRRIAVTLLLCSGLFASNSRGAWLGAAITYFTFLAAGPRGASRVMRGAVIGLAIAGVILVSPLGDQILDMLPAAGQAADPYRHRLAERGWEVVLAHPVFGDQFPWPEMEDLRQGEGIIDIVNSYLDFALNYGLVGLTCYISLIFVGLITVYARSKKLTHSDPDLALLGRSLVACIVGLLVMLDSVSFNMGVEKIFYVLAALTLAYARLTREPQHHSAALGSPTRPSG